VTTTVDISSFQAALKRHLTQTSRELSNAINMRMSFVLMRAYLSLDPKNPQAERSRLKAIFDTVIEERLNRAGTRRAGKRKGKAKQFMAKHRLTQWWRAKTGKHGLYGEEMTQAAGKFSRGRQGSVGALKAVCVAALRKFMPAFTQFGSSTKKAGGRQVAPNAALVRLAGEYGHGVGSNVGLRRNAKSDARPARPGFNPHAEALLSLGVKDGQPPKVEQRWNTAFARAFSDETAEMLRHLGETVVDNAKVNGFTTT
jgi:hypothetical protein